MKGYWLSLLLLVGPFALSACSTADQAQPTPSPQAEASARAVSGIIVKPKQSVADDAALMTLVSAHLITPAQVTFLRPMSGGAYVLNVVPPATKTDVPTIIAQLVASGAFEFVEEDQMMTIQR